MNSLYHIHQERTITMDRQDYIMMEHYDIQPSAAVDGRACNLTRLTAETARCEI